MNEEGAQRCALDSHFAVFCVILSRSPPLSVLITLCYDVLILCIQKKCIKTTAMLCSSRCLHFALASAETSFVSPILSLHNTTKPCIVVLLQKIPFLSTVTLTARYDLRSNNVVDCRTMNKIIFDQHILTHKEDPLFRDLVLPPPPPQMPVPWCVPIQCSLPEIYFR
jgi:hypothetical protein